MAPLRRLSIGLVWLTFFGVRSSVVHAQTEPSCTMRENFHWSGDFIAGYRRAQCLAVAEAILKDNPLSLDAVELLLRAGRRDDAIGLLERLADAHPDALASVTALLRTLPGDAEDPEYEARAARVKQLEARVAQLPKPAAAGTRAVTIQERHDESEQMFLAAQKEVDRAVESLGRRRKWSERSVAAATSRAFSLLRNVAEGDGASYGTRALGLLADKEFEAGQLRGALSDYLLLEQRDRNSDVPWAWAEAMRAAQLTQFLSGPDEAAKSFARVAAAYGDRPTVLALATFYEARAYEEMSRWSDALRAYRTSLDAWPEADDEWSGLDWKVWYFGYPYAESLWPAYIRRGDVVHRIEALTKVAADPSLGAIEQAEWLIERKLPSQARDMLRRAASTSGKAPPPTALRPLLHRAELDTAISTISRNGQLPSGAWQDLERLCAEPFDPWVGISCAIHASALAGEGKADAARAQLQKALHRWVDAQSGVAAAASSSMDDITRDAMAIRDLLFQQDSFDGLRQRDEPYTPPAFLFMPTDVEVTTHQVTARRHVANRIPRGRANVIVLSTVEARTLWHAVAFLSTCGHRRQQERLSKLWFGTLGFAVEPCTAGGSYFTAPQIDRIHFMNPERTVARVIETTGSYSSGGKLVVVEKVNGDWKQTRVVTVWEY